MQLIGRLLGWYDRALAQAQGSLATLLDAGLPIAQAIEEVSFQGVITGEQKTKWIAAVRAGEPFADVARRLSLLPKLDLACIGAAEKSGHLPEVLQDLSRRHEENSNLRSSVITQMIYPMILLHFAAAVFPIATLFKDGMQAFIVEMLGTLFLFYGVIAILLMGIFLLPRSPIVPLLLGLPVIGKAIRSMELSTFCGALQRMHDAGVGWLQAFEESAETLTLPWFRERSRSGIPVLEKGGTFSDAVQATSIFRSPELQLLATGETSGSLGEALGNVARMLRQQGKEAVKRTTLLVSHGLHLLIVLWVAGRILLFYGNLYGSLPEGIR